MSDAMPEAELIELAAVVRTHGLRGEVILKLFNPESELIEQSEQVLLKDREGVLTPVGVVRARRHGEGLLVAFDHAHDRDAAEALRGNVVCLPRAALPALEEGEYYLVDLVGLQVRSSSGETIGVVRDIIEYPSVCCLVVESGETVREVPDLPRYVPEVDVRAGFVVVDNLDELDALTPGKERE